MSRLNFLQCQILFFISGLFLMPLYLEGLRGNEHLFAYALVGAVVSFITFIYRLKNIGISSAWVLLVFIPVINIIFLLFLFFKAAENVEKKELKRLRKEVEVKELKKKLKELEEEE